MANYINGVAAATLGVADIQIELVNMDVDKAVITINAELGAALPSVFTPDAIVTISMDNPDGGAQPLILMRGRVQPATASARGEQQVEVEVHGPWASLEDIPYTEVRTDPITGAQYRSGDFELSGTLSACVLTVLQYARGRSPADFNEIIIVDLPAITIPTLTGRDQSCAQIIRNLMGWLKTAQVVFGYYGDPPIIYALKNDSASWEGNLSTSNLSSLEYHLESKLQPENVIIRYVRPMTIERRYKNIAADETVQTTRHVAFDLHPSNAATSRRSLSATIAMKQGQKFIHYRHRFTDAAAQTFGYLTSRPSISSSYRIGDLLYIAGYPVDTFSSYGNVLDRSVPYCVERSYAFTKIGGGAGAFPSLDQLYVLRRREADGGNWDQLPDSRNWGGDGVTRIWSVAVSSGWSTAIGAPASKYFAHTIYVIWAGGASPYNREFEHWWDDTTAVMDQPGSGIASAVYAALQPVHTGRMQYYLAGWTHRRRRVSLSGIVSPIQRLEIDLSNDAVTAHFGPPEHLGPQDVFDLFKSST